MSLINKDSSIPLYEQLYEAFKKQILSGAIPAGKRLPATRKLAADLAVGRNTVDNAYQQLELEGYVTAKVGAGFIVNDLSILEGEWKEMPTVEHRTPIKKATPPRYDFGSGRAATAQFPVKIWKKYLCDGLLDEAEAHSFVYPELTGESSLRRAIQEHLFNSRGIDCQAENIVITSGLEFSIERLLMLFERTEDFTVAMENPGYHTARQSFLLSDCRVAPIPVESDGINIEQVQSSNAKLLYVTPSHQFPTGAVLSIKKRIALIEWAKKTNSYIIEDDYDSELRYNAKPSPALFSIDANRHTIYLGTFSKSFSPGIRIAFMVLPDILMERYWERFHALHNSVPTTQQKALARFIRDGHYSRYIDRLRVLNKRKNQTLVHELTSVFGDRATITGAGAGQHILVDIHADLNEQQLLDTALAAGVKLHSAAKYWSSKADANPHQIMMGYGGIALEDIPAAIRLLYDLWMK